MKEQTIEANGTFPQREQDGSPLLRVDRLPHQWCPGCGIGTCTNCFITAITEAKLDPDKLAVVSGIGCTGRVAGYLKLDSFHTTHGRAIPFATGLKLGRPELSVIVFSGDGDLVGIGGNHFIHAARRNIDLLVILVNNLIYGMTGGQTAATTPLSARSATMPHGNFEPPFSLPHLADTCGATYVARWTSAHVRRLTSSIKEAMKKKGFRFIEIIAPCPTLYARLNKLGKGLELMQFYVDNAEIQNGADTREVGIDFQQNFLCGKFIDRERSTYLEMMHTHYQEVLGDSFVPLPETGGMCHGTD